jgi:type III secretory pathway lipoprotein EscJ
LYKLLSKKELNIDNKNAKDLNLVRILVAAEAVLRDVYWLCSNTLPDWKMTQQQANILNKFYTRVLSKADRF